MIGGVSLGGRTNESYGVERMFGIEYLTGDAQAAAIVGIIVAEALILNVGYGLLVRAAGPAVTAALTET